jgi:hypothetical protein
VPRNTQTISIFLASPSDVSAERDLVSQVVAEWNQIHSRSHGVYFEILRWETNVSAGFGDDAQQVVSSQVGDDYDALIAIFWARVGTETPRSQSGSIEEYERALSRHAAGEQVEIAFFFKDAPVSLKEIDFLQAQAVDDLKARLHQDGALFKEFIDMSGLRYEVNLLLDRLSRRFNRDSRGSERVAPSISNPTSDVTDRQAVDAAPADVHLNEEIGFIDISESMTTHSSIATEFLSEMTSRLNSMTQETSEVSSTLEELGKLGAAQPHVVKPLIARITNGMDGFSDFLETRGSEYAEHSLGVAEDARSLIDLARDFQTSDASLGEFEGNLAILLGTMDEGLKSMGGMLDSTEGLPRMTVAFNHSRRRLANNLKQYIADSQSARNVVQKALDEIRTLRGSGAA